ncbi:peptidoglycan bridge formation glycyltransferase FemA/FemB family protein [Patescibacteria group bacterium]|nr:peptidoglycan bridge formation glycyltransferase FemA/FemB family protein [Patescibacteria group bacterium]
MDDIKMEDIRQTKEWGRYLESCGWVVDKVGDISVFIKKVPLTPFSMMKIQRFSGKLDLSDLKRVKRKYKVVYTVIEPFGEKSQGRINRHPYLPTKSIIVDLANNEKQLWSDLSKTTKQTLKKNNYIDSRLRGNDEEEQNDKKRHSGKLSLRNASRIWFYEAWKGSSKTWLMGEKRFNKLLDAFGKKASLWVSESEGEFLSGILLLESKDTANYFQTWTSKEGRRIGAHYHLVWQVILECKKKGLKWFDFEGILDERWPQKKWAGFSRFKKKFGGKVVTYPGSFTKWF